MVSRVVYHAIFQVLFLVRLLIRFFSCVLISSSAVEHLHDFSYRTVLLRRKREFPFFTAIRVQSLNTYQHARKHAARTINLVIKQLRYVTMDFQNLFQKCFFI